MKHHNILNYSKILSVKDKNFHLLAFLLLSFYVVFLPNFAVTGASYLDPWSYRGFGLNWGDNINFPQPNWNGYYKESRIPYLIFLFVLEKLIFDNYFTLILAFFYLYTIYYLNFKLFNLSSNLLRFTLSLLAALNPMLLSSGGFYYHNNFIYIIFVLSLVLLKSNLVIQLKLFAYIFLSTCAISVNPIAGGIFLFPLFFYIGIIYLNSKNIRVLIKYFFYTLISSFFSVLILGLTNKYIMNRNGRFWRAQVNHLLSIDRNYLSAWYVSLDIWVLENYYSLISILICVFSIYMVTRRLENFERILFLSFITNFFITLVVHIQGNPIWNSEYMLFPLVLSGFYSMLYSTYISLKLNRNKYSLIFFYVLLVLSLFLQSNLNFIEYLQVSSFFSIIVLFFLLTIIFVKNFFPKIIFLSLLCFIFVQPVAWNYSNNINNVGLYFDNSIVQIQRHVRSTALTKELTYVWADPTVRLLSDFSNTHPSNYSNASAQMGLIYLGPAFPQLDFESLLIIPELSDVLINHRILIFAISKNSILEYVNEIESKFSVKLDTQIYQIENFGEYSYALIRIKNQSTS